MKILKLQNILVLLIIFILNACAVKKQTEKEQFIIPAQPELPRIMHLKTYRGESDLFKKDKINSFLGEINAFSGKDFAKPFGVTAKNGKFYVTDTAFGVVFIFDTINKKVTFLGNKGSGKLSLPIGIALDENENVYVSDSKLQRIFAYDQEGELIFVLGEDDEFIRPTGIAINEELQRLYVSDTKGHVIRVFSLNGDFLFDIGQRGVGDGEFNFPTNIAIDKNSGNLVVVDTQNFRIQIFDEDGEFIKTFGNIGDKPGTFSRPKGVGIDSDGNIYISDTAFNNIQIFDKTGTQLLLFFGSAGSEPGKFQSPSSIFFDENDKFYITENFSGKVQVFQYISDMWKYKNRKKYKELMKSREIEE